MPVPMAMAIPVWCSESLLKRLGCAGEMGGVRGVATIADTSGTGNSCGRADAGCSAGLGVRSVRKALLLVK